MNKTLQPNADYCGERIGYTAACTAFIQPNICNANHRPEDNRCWRSPRCTGLSTLPAEAKSPPNKEHSDGSTASYYQLPGVCLELQDLISHKDMNAQMGEIFRACYRYGQAGHSSKQRDIKKIIFYANAELDRLERYESESKEQAE